MVAEQPKQEYHVQYVAYDMDWVSAGRWTLWPGRAVRVVSPHLTPPLACPPPAPDRVLVQVLASGRPAPGAAARARANARHACSSVAGPERHGADVRHGPQTELPHGWSEPDMRVVLRQPVHEALTAAHWTCWQLWELPPAQHACTSQQWLAMRGNGKNMHALGCQQQAAAASMHWMRVEVSRR